MPRVRSHPFFWTLQLVGWAGCLIAMAFSSVGATATTRSAATGAVVALGA